MQFDGTPFATEGRTNVDEYGKMLEEYGFDKFGDEPMYDGRTGRKFDAKVFTGVVYYQQTVAHGQPENAGQKQGSCADTHTAADRGKPRRGGLKFGEMERDALVGHGASLLLKERMLDQSDKAEIWVCSDCGDVGYYDYMKNTPVCQTCGGKSLEKVEISYAFKLLLDEVKSLHILPRIKMKSE